jgi:hypothetical protein
MGAMFIYTAPPEGLPARKNAIIIQKNRLPRKESGLFVARIIGISYSLSPKDQLLERNAELCS